MRHPRDAIIKVTACAMCGSDLHIYDGAIPSMESGDILGHETTGEVVEVGAENKRLKVGDRVVVPFTIACGECFFCNADFTRAANSAGTHGAGACCRRADLDFTAEDSADGIDAGIRSPLIVELLDAEAALPPRHGNLPCIGTSIARARLP